MKWLSLQETFSLKQGIKKFDQKGYASEYGEIIQLHQKNTFE